jgi:hypothetical protein
MKGLVVGRIVHYVTNKGVHCAGIIVKVVNQQDGHCNISVFLPDENGVWIRLAVPYSDTFDTNTWHWIERED